MAIQCGIVGLPNVGKSTLTNGIISELRQSREREVERLALNVASTRVVLLNGHTGTGSAGKVIESFGEFVVGGNYAVGLVVFAILVIINFVVVTKGAGRVSEVSARFTLDAMPGKQMAIDADVNAGVLDQEEARKRRAEIGGEFVRFGPRSRSGRRVRRLRFAFREVVHDEIDLDACP